MPMLDPSSLVAARAVAGVRLAQLILISALGACAQGFTGDEIGNLTMDASQIEAAVPEAAIVWPTEEASTVVPEASAPVVDAAPSNPGTSDAGVRDAAPAPSDTGASSDAANDTGPSEPLDATPATPDTSTPVVDASPPPVDTSTPPVDTGTPDTSVPNNGAMCASTPTYATTTACAKCTCSKCGSAVQACYASSDTAKNTQCMAVQACAEKNTCWGQECYCGGSALCLNPNGPCRQVIETAGNTNDPLEINNQGNDTNTSLGRAKAIGSCQSMQCKNECGL